MAIAKKAAAPKGGTSGAGGDKSNTRTATRTATSTEAYTQGNITITGGAGKGATTVHIAGQVPSAKGKTGTSKVGSVKKAAPMVGHGSSHTSQK